MKLSILDYVPIFEGRSATDALNHTVDLAQLAEQLGYYRYWIAEHHQVFSVASSAPEMVMMSLLENTTSIKIGSGGVMLPHYSAYKVAEIFKIMEAHHPKRVNLGTGHSPSYKNVNQALNEFKTEKPDYLTQIKDLIHYFNDDINDDHRFNHLRATPTIDSQPDMFILGTSKTSATLAAKQGLSFVIANMGQNKSQLQSVINHYRLLFKQYHPTKSSYVLMSSFVITATEISLRESLARAFHLWLLRIGYLNQPKFYPSLSYAAQRNYSSRELEKIDQHQSRVIVGSPDEVVSKLKLMMTDFDADEIMIQPHVYGESNRKTLLRLLAQANA